MSAPRDKTTQYLDGYKGFGWVTDENGVSGKRGGGVLLQLKRDRKILNETELTRLQQHFEACMEETSALEKSKTSAATMLAILIGVLGTAFMALSTFAVTPEPSRILLCVLFAAPGLSGWALPYFAYRAIAGRKMAKIAPLIGQKYEEAYEACEKGSNLRSN